MVQKTPLMRLCDLREKVAYHGTPHEFEHFSLRYMNTGEGNQAYGYGIYLAQNPDVAEYYADATTQHDPDDRNTIGAMTVDGHYFNARLPEEHLTPLQRAALSYHFAGNNQSDAIKSVRDMIEFTDNEMVKAMYRETLHVLETERLTGRTSVARPKVYHVEINRPDDDFLLWREPYTEQSQHVQQVMDKLSYGRDGLRYFDATKITGQLFYLKIADMERHRLGKTDSPLKYMKRYASMRLYKGGIAGTRYLDASEFNTRLYNYVVFNPREIEITNVE